MGKKSYNTYEQVSVDFLRSYPEACSLSSEKFGLVEILTENCDSS